MVKCQQCASDMEKSKRTKSNLLIQLVALILFLFGGLMAVSWGLFGVILGGIIMLGSFGMGYKVTKIWLCPSCGYFFERAK